MSLSSISFAGLTKPGSGPGARHSASAAASPVLCRPITTHIPLSSAQRACAQPANTSRAAVCSRDNDGSSGSSSVLYKHTSAAMGTYIVGNSLKHVRVVLSHCNACPLRSSSSSRSLVSTAETQIVFAHLCNDCIHFQTNAHEFEKSLMGRPIGFGPCITRRAVATSWHRSSSLRSSNSSGRNRMSSLKLKP